MILKSIFVPALPLDGGGEEEDDEEEEEEIGCRCPGSSLSVFVCMTVTELDFRIFIRFGDGVFVFMFVLV